MKPPTFIECSLCGREFGSKSITIHERQCLQKLRRTEIVEEQKSEHRNGKGKRKRVPSVSPVSMPTATKNWVSISYSPTPQSPKNMLPKIQTEFGKRTINSLAVRPTTATLSKPKFLNPEYISYDMSLMRIDYETAQLRLTDDDENYNFRRSNFVLPSVSSGFKSKIPSAPKFSSSDRGGLVKLPLKSTSCHEFKKQPSTDSSVMLVLPNSDLSKSTQFDPVPKSLPFPCLPCENSSALMKGLKSIENPFPQITQYRSSGQLSSPYVLTPGFNLPRFDDCNENEWRRQSTGFVHKHFNRTANETEITDSRKTNGTEPTFFPIPQVLFMSNKPCFAAISEQSFDTSFESLERSSGADCSPVNKLCQVKELDGSIENLHESAHTTFTVAEKKKVSPFTYATPILANCFEATRATCTGQRQRGDIPLPKTYPKLTVENCHIGEESSSSTFSSNGSDPRRQKYNASSTSDVDNEGTSSGYRLLRTINSSRTMLRKRNLTGIVAVVKRQVSKIQRPVPTPVVIPKSCNSTPNEMATNVGTSSNLPTREKMLQYPLLKFTPYEKVNRWLQDCKEAVGDDRDVQWGEHFGRPEALAKATAQENASADENIWELTQGLSLQSSMTPSRQNSSTLISGLVTVTFKVQDADETRTYNFVKELCQKKKSRTETKSGETKPTSNTKSQGLFRCYAPPKCLRRNKRIVQMLQKISSTYVPKRPTTAPPLSSLRMKTLPIVKTQAPKIESQNAEVKMVTSKKEVTLTSSPGNTRNTDTDVIMSSTKIPSEPKSCPRSILTQDGHSSQNSITGVKIRPVTTRQPVPCRLTLLRSRPDSRTLDKGSQTPETRSTCVQYSPLVTPKASIHK